MRVEQGKQIFKEIKSYVESGKKRFIIFPFGEYVKQVLNQEFGIKELCLLDNYKKQEGIYTLEYLSAYSEKEDCYLLLAIENKNQQQSLMNQASAYISEDRILQLFQNQNSDFFCSKEEEEHKAALHRKAVVKGKELIDSIVAQDKKKLYFLFRSKRRFVGSSIFNS